MPGEPVRAIYFPETGYTSRLSPLEDGDFAEVGLVSSRGLGTAGVRRGPGVSLGLAIAQRFAQASNGSLELGESREGGLLPTFFCRGRRAERSAAVTYFVMPQRGSAVAAAPC
jgi:hypothetical protein